jgi:protein gp37
MAETSNIGWTDATVNWWWGCSAAGPGCLNCYAEAWNNFRGNGQWGPGAPRTKIKGAPALLKKLQRGATAFFAEHGRRRRVFMQSMSDTFDNEVDPTWREEMLEAIEEAPDLNIQLVTKRGPNVRKMAARWAGGSWPRHVGLIYTVVNQPEFDRDIARLRDIKRDFSIPWVGFSVEPMIERINMHGRLFGIDWVIVGCESGKNARHFDIRWAQDIREACAGSGTAYFLKQIPSPGVKPITDIEAFPLPLRHQEFPEALR